MAEKHLVLIFKYLKDFSENLPPNIFELSDTSHHILEDQSFKAINQPSIGHLVRLVIEILYNFASQIQKISSISNNEEIKQIYLPNQICQFMGETLSNLLFSTDEIRCAQIVLEIYNIMIKVFGETKNIKFKTIFIQELCD